MSQHHFIWFRAKTVKLFSLLEVEIEVKYS